MLRPGKFKPTRDGHLVRILLVEDHQPLAFLQHAFLTQQGYEVVCARDGQQACRLLQQETFDLVLTDSELPKTSGWEVASAAKKRHLRVILSSGWPVRLSSRQRATRGVDFVAPKPCTLEQLLALIEAALKKSPSHKR